MRQTSWLSSSDQSSPWAFSDWRLGMVLLEVGPAPAVRDLQRGLGFLQRIIHGRARCLWGQLTLLMSAWSRGLAVRFLPVFFNRENGSSTVISYFSATYSLVLQSEMIHPTRDVEGLWHNSHLADRLCVLTPIPHGVMAAHGSLEPFVLVRVQVGEPETVPAEKRGLFFYLIRLPKISSHLYRFIDGCHGRQIGWHLEESRTAEPLPKELVTYSVVRPVAGIPISLRTFGNLFREARCLLLRMYGCAFGTAKHWCSFRPIHSTALPCGLGRTS